VGPDLLVDHLRRRRLPQTRPPHLRMPNRTS
jgi:hypothetical protein